MEKLDKKTYRGIVKFTLESMLNLRIEFNKKPSPL